MRIIAPGGAIAAEPFERGLALIQQMQLNPTWDPQLLTADRYFAGSLKRRRDELMAALADSSVDAIWAARGGYGAAQLLEYVDPDMLGKHPKWLIGFSDITALHTLWQQQGQISLHGANVTTLADWSEMARQELQELLMQTGAFAHTSKMVFSGTCVQQSLQTPAQQSVEGIVWGGNLTVLASLVGTPALPALRDPTQPSLLFLEEIQEAPYRLDRYWQQLAASGTLKNVCGVAIGQLTRCDAPQAGYTGLAFLQEAIARSGFASIAGLSIGHEADSRCLPLGSYGRLDLKHCTLTVYL